MVVLLREQSVSDCRHLSHVGAALFSAGVSLLIATNTDCIHKPVTWRAVGNLEATRLLTQNRDYTGAADKAVNLVGCKSPHHQLPGQVVSRSDACGGNEACSARMSKPRLPCGDESQR